MMHFCIFLKRIRCEYVFCVFNFEFIYFYTKNHQSCQGKQKKFSIIKIFSLNRFLFYFFLHITAINNLKMTIACERTLQKN
jgi:hypothetical protein